MGSTSGSAPLKTQRRRSAVLREGRAAPSSRVPNGDDEDDVCWLNGEVDGVPGARQKHAPDLGVGLTGKACAAFRSAEMAASSSRSKRSGAAGRFESHQLRIALSLGVRRNPNEAAFHRTRWPGASVAPSRSTDVTWPHDGVESSSSRCGRRRRRWNGRRGRWWVSRRVIARERWFRCHRAWRGAITP